MAAVNPMGSAFEKVYFPARCGHANYEIRAFSYVPLAKQGILLIAKVWFNQSVYGALQLSPSSRVVRAERGELFVHCFR